MTETDVKTFGQKLDALAAGVQKLLGFSRLETPIAQTLKDKEGKEFKLEKEAGEPAVGDKAAPDGTYPMADGKTIVVAGGVITEIKEPAVEDIAALKKTITEQAAKIIELQTAITAAEAARTELATKASEYDEKKAELTTLTAELKALRNTWKPAARDKASGGAAAVGGAIDKTEVENIYKNHNKE